MDNSESCYPLLSILKNNKNWLFLQSFPTLAILTKLH
jgi:hypothetical protein